MPKKRIKIIEETEIDQHCVRISINICVEEIVFLQACLESYEGLAVVRTEEVRTEDPSVGTLSIYTTKQNLISCRELLESL